MFEMQFAPSMCKMLLQDWTAPIWNHVPVEEQLGEVDRFS